MKLLVNRDEVFCQELSHNFQFSLNDSSETLSILSELLQYKITKITSLLEPSYKAKVRNICIPKKFMEKNSRI